MRKFSIFNFQFSIFVVAFLCGLFYFGRAEASLLYAESAQEKVYAGQSVVVDWFLNTEGQSVNSLDLKFNFSPQTLELTEASAGNSVVSLWVRPPSLSGLGRLELIGGMPGGALGSGLPVFRSVFKTKTAGIAQINLDALSQVLLNDGEGTKDALNFSPLVFTVLPQSEQIFEVRSPSHINQDYWYQDNKVEIYLPSDLVHSPEKYAYSFSSNVEVIPPAEPMVLPNLGALVYENLPDGIYYFKLYSLSANGQWQEVAVFRARVDTTPPEEFKAETASDPGIFEGREFISFSTVDKASGVKEYQVKQGLFGSFVKAQSPYELQRSLVGDEVVIQATDYAGNSRDFKLYYKGHIPEKIFKIIAGVLIILVFMVLYFYKALHLLHFVRAGSKVSKKILNFVRNKKK